MTLAAPPLRRAASSLGVGAAALLAAAPAPASASAARTAPGSVDSNWGGSPGTPSVTRSNARTVPAPSGVQTWGRAPGRSVPYGGTQQTGISVRELHRLCPVATMSTMASMQQRAAKASCWSSKSTVGMTNNRHQELSSCWIHQSSPIKAATTMADSRVRTLIGFLAFLLGWSRAFRRQERRWPPTWAFFNGVPCAHC